MVQEFHVLRCFSCESFQVQQVKKVNRWSCKMCGEKQSLLKEFGRGSGADCRRHVQKLNAMRGAMMEEQEQTWSLWKQVEEDGEDEPEEHDQVTQAQVTQAQVTQAQVSQAQVSQAQGNRWSKYLNTPEEAEPEEEEEENVLMDREQFHGNHMINRKKRRREGWTDGGRQDSQTPEQANRSSPMTKPVRPSAPTRTTSLNRTSSPSLNYRTSPPSLNRTSSPSLNYRTSPPSLNRTSSPNLNYRTSPPNKKSIDPPSASTGPISKWARFLSSDCQVNEEEEGEEPASSARPRPPLPVSSMFESGAEFSFDDEFLTAEKL